MHLIRRGKILLISQRDRWWVKGLAVPSGEWALGLPLEREPSPGRELGVAPAQGLDPPGIDPRRCNLLDQSKQVIKLQKKVSQMCPQSHLLLYLRATNTLKLPHLKFSSWRAFQTSYNGIAAVFEAGETTYNY